MTRPVRILAIHRYFWPDTPPYASILRTIAGHWSHQGHRVEVLTSQPSYRPGPQARMPSRQRVDDVEVHRLRMRPDEGPRARKLRNMVRFSWLVFWRVLVGPRRDVVMCSTAPQVVLGWATSWAARLRRARFVYHVMDLHPEIGRLSGEFSRPLVYRTLLGLDRATCRRAAAIVVLSADMEQVLLRRDPGLAGRIHVLPNLDLPDFDPVKSEAITTSAADPEAPLTIAFTGNLGRYQGLQTVLAAVLDDADPRLDDVRLVLMGDGTARAELQRMVAAAPEDRRRRVDLRPQGSVAEARALMRTADLGLVCLAAEVIRYAYPSKTATYLSEGLPVLVAVEADSALAREVVAWGVGDLLPRGDVEATRHALLEWRARRAELPALRERARRTWEERFSAPRLLQDWDTLLGEALASPGTREVAR